jgi:hypothetical protein
MSAGQTAVVVLLAVLVGAVLPVLVQLFLTLGRLRRVIDGVGRRLEPTLDEIAESARRLNRVGSGLEQNVVPRVHKLAEGLGDLGESVAKLRQVVRTAANVGAALGPAVAAAARSFGSCEGDGAKRREGAEAPAEGGAPSSEPFPQREEVFDEQQ